MIHNLLDIVLKGGAKNKMPKMTMGKSFLFILIGSILDLLFRALIVTYGYNMVVPKLIQTTTSNPEKILQNFRPLTFWDSIIIIITLSTLINCKSYTFIKRS